MDNEKKKLSVEVAKLYYQLDYSQQQIATQLGISRPTISRLLQYAKEEGYVKINIIDPFSNSDKFAHELKEQYELKDVRIALSPRDDYVSIRKYISKEAALYLEDKIKNGDIIGVSWGTTMYEVAKQLTPKNVNGVKVVQLKGGISHSEVNTYAAETINLFAKAFQTLPIYLPLPVIFDSFILRQMVEKDSNVKSTIEMGIKANIAIFTVGTVRDDALLFRLGYLSETEKQSLKQESVGDICSRFFNKDGEICNEKINNRTIGISIDALKQKEKSILVAGGKLKLEAIQGALKSKSANILITDQYTAKRLLNNA